LTKEDEKTYWGKISYEDEHETESQDGTNPINAGGQKAVDAGDEDESDNSNRRLYVHGSVIFGYALEPQPVGRFIMTETSGTDMDLDDDEEDDEDDVDEGEDEPTDDFLDWSNAFQ
jgi:hypothetical protein